MQQACVNYPGGLEYPMLLTLYVPTLTQTPNFLKILLYKPTLTFVDFSCMSITVLLQNARASYVPRFNFGGFILDEKFGVQIAKVQIFLIFAKTMIVQKNFRYTTKIQKGRLKQD